MGQTVAPFDLHVAGGHVYHLYQYLVGWAGVVWIDDTDAVGDHEAALERGAASGENREEVTGRHLDDEAGPDESDLSGCDDEVVGSRHIEPGRVVSAVRREGNSGI